MNDPKSLLKERLDKFWLSPDLQSFFEKFSKKPPHLVKKGTILFNSGDPLSGIYFIKSGFIKLYRLSGDGKETIIYLTGPGNLLGLRALISEDQKARHYTEAITDCEIFNMTRKEYFDILSEHPEYLIDLMYVFIDRLNHAERRVEGFISQDATSKVAHFLVDAAIRFGKKREKSINLPFPITHQRIAEFVGIYRETVTLALHELVKKGAITLKRSQIIIRDLDKLKTFTL